jgi:hypothetical protein
MVLKTYGTYVKVVVVKYGTANQSCGNSVLQAVNTIAVIYRTK